MDRGSEERAGTEGLFLARDATVDGRRGVYDQAVGDGEAFVGLEDDAVEVDNLVVETADVRD